MLDDYDLVNQALRELLVIFKYTKDSAFDVSLRIKTCYWLGRESAESALPAV
jgi:hypothetical protein